MLQHANIRGFIPNSYQELRNTVFFFIAFISAGIVSHFTMPQLVQTGLDLSFPIALTAVFFFGYRLLPYVFVASMITEYVIGVPKIIIVVLPISIVLQSFIGVFLMRRWSVDPIFRRDRNVLQLIAIFSIISVIGPSLYAIVCQLFNILYLSAAWVPTYISILFSYIIIAPFLLRWIAKPRFTRTTREGIETISVFTLMILIETLIFIDHFVSIFGIPIEIFLLLPLFAIALRLRPRFVTLAVLLTACFAIGGFVISSDARVFGFDLFQIEIILIAGSSTLLVITSLEEHRRATANRLHSQVATLENVVARISSESQAKNDFIAILAHELRNPLTPVVSGIEILKLNTSLTKDETETLYMMEDGMLTVRSLLDDLLDVSRISEGKISFEKQSVDIEDVLKSAIFSTEHHRKEHHQDLVFKRMSKPIHVLGDRVRLEQIFSNLLTNASKYSDSGDSVTLNVTAEKSFAEITVTDKGVGIDPSALETIFLPFHQIEMGKRSQQGLGIGLSLVQNFVQLHDGTVRAESDGKGRGSRFIVRLPLAP